MAEASSRSLGREPGSSLGRLEPRDTIGNTGHAGRAARGRGIGRSLGQPPRKCTPPAPEYVVSPSSHHVIGGVRFLTSLAPPGGCIFGPSVSGFILCAARAMLKAEAAPRRGGGTGEKGALVRYIFLCRSHQGCRRERMGEAVSQDASPLRDTSPSSSTPREKQAAIVVHEQAQPLSIRSGEFPSHMSISTPPRASGNPGPRETLLCLHRYRRPRTLLQS
jgi:hypothetical protein